MEQGRNKFKSRLQGILDKVRSERSRFQGHVADFQRVIASASSKLSEIRSSSLSSSSFDLEQSPEGVSDENLNTDQSGNEIGKFDQEIQSYECSSTGDESSEEKLDSEADRLDFEREWLALTEDVCKEENDTTETNLARVQNTNGNTLVQNNNDIINYNKNYETLNTLEETNQELFITDDNLVIGLPIIQSKTSKPRILEVEQSRIAEPIVTETVLTPDEGNDSDGNEIPDVDVTDGERLDVSENEGKLSRSDTGNTCILIMDKKSENPLSTNNEGGGKSLLSTPTEEPRNKSPITIQEWVDSLPVQEQAPRKEEEAEEVESATDWEVENLTLGAEAAIVCPPEPCPAVQITGVREGSDAGSHCSSMESFLESRKQDPEELLLELGFGGSQTQTDNISRIPSRFLQPSNLKGVNIEQFLRQQQEMADTIQSSFNGYRGLTGRQHERPSVIVGKIMEKLREAESGVNRRRANLAQHSATDVSPKLATVARNLLNRLRVVRAEGSVLSPDNRAWLEAQGDRSPEPKNRKLIIGKQSFTFTNDGKDLIPCKSRSPSRSPSNNRLSPRTPGSEERLTPSPNRLSPRDANRSDIDLASPNHLSPRNSDKDLLSPNRLSPRSSDKDLLSPNRLSPRFFNRSEDHLSVNRLSPKDCIRNRSNVDLMSNRLSPMIFGKSDDNLPSNNNNIVNLLRLSPSNGNLNTKIPILDNKQSKPIEITVGRSEVELSRHFASLCNVHRPVPRRRSAGYTDSEPSSSLERKTSEPQVKSCGCSCHPLSSSAPMTLSPSNSTPSSTQEFAFSSYKEEVESTEEEYKILSDLATELTPSELLIDLMPEEQYVILSDEERHGLLVNVLENALCAYEERLEALELGTGLTRVLYSHLDRVSRLLQSSDSNLLVGIAQQVTSLLQHQASLKQELELQEKQTELKLANEIS